MRFEESLEWLYATQQFGIKLGLDNTFRLLKALGDPQDRLDIIHVAGTNGKGSVCAMLDAIARESGRRTGLYTSPHLVDFRERIRVNGEKIPQDELTALLTRIREISESWEHLPTFFEITTALALAYFAREKCELVILETGMGGRLDATNAVTPRVSVITPIALDHTQWLGDTIRAVAGEKAGIIKRGVPVVSSEQEEAAEEVLRKTAAAAHASIEFITEPLEDYEIPLTGRFQRLNASLARAALEKSGFAARNDALRSGLRNVRWPGRFHEHGRFILDGGHNPHAAISLVQNWRERFGGEKAFVIFGALADKDYESMLGILSPIAEEFLMVPVKSPRAASAATLKSTSPGARKADTLAEAMAVGVRQSRPVLITGSLFLVGEAMALLGMEP